MKTTKVQFDRVRYIISVLAMGHKFDSDSFHFESNVIWKKSNYVGFFAQIVTNFTPGLTSRRL